MAQRDRLPSKAQGRGLCLGGRNPRFPKTALVREAVSGCWEGSGEEARSAGTAPEEEVRPQAAVGGAEPAPEGLCCRCGHARWQAWACGSRPWTQDHLNGYRLSSGLPLQSWTVAASEGGPRRGPGGPERKHCPGAAHPAGGGGRSVRAAGAFSLCAYGTFRKGSAFGNSGD